MSAVRDISALRTLKGISGRDAGNTLRTVQKAIARDAGNVSRAVFGALSASLSPNYVQGSGNSQFPITISTGATTVTVNGGTPPFTYAWTQMSGSGSWGAVSPTQASTSFRRLSVPAGDEETATFKCTVTDASSQTATTGTVTAEVRNLNAS